MLYRDSSTLQASYVVDQKVAQILGEFTRASREVSA